MADHDLAQLVKTATPTFFSVPHNTWSTIDLVFASKDHLADSLVKCVTAPGHGSDHTTIVVIFDLEVTHCDPPLRRNFRVVDWEEFRPLLDTHLRLRSVLTRTPSRVALQLRLKSTSL